DGRARITDQRSPAGRGCGSMDVVERIRAGLPPSVDELDAGGPWDVSELWLLARAYSRLRHRSRTPDERRGWAWLKDYCIPAAVARDPDQFVVAIGPGMPSFRFVYHRAERSLLHIPISTELPGFSLAAR